MVLSLAESVLYARNSGTMMAHYEDEARSHGVGKPSMENLAHRKTCQRKMAKLRAHMVWLRSLKELTRQTEPNMAVSQGGSTVGVEVSYNYKHARAGRRYASTPGAQNCPKALRSSVLSESVEDWDMRNAMCSLITQVLPWCAAPAHIPSIRLPALNRYARDPVGTRAWALTHLGVDAKNIILAVVHGKAPPEVGDSELRSWLQDRGLPRLFSSSFVFN